MGLKTVDSIVNSALIGIGESSITTLKPKFLHWALKAVQELNYDVSAGIKTVKIDVEGNNTIPFPTDYVNYGKLGIIKDNYIILLKYNPEIPLFDEKCDDQTTVKVRGAYGTVPFHNFESSNRVTGYLVNYGSYGVGGGFNNEGHFRVDERMQRFVFDSEFTHSQVVLEYFTNGINCDGQTMVHEFAADVIEEYVRFQYARMDRTTRMGQLQLQKEMYRSARRKYKQRKLAPTLKEVLDTVRSATYLAPKY